MRHSRQPRQSAQNDKLVTMISIRFLSAIAVAAALAACGGSTAGNGGNPAPGSGGKSLPTLPPGLSTPKPVVVTGEITLTQPKAVTAKFTNNVDATSCQEYAKDGGHVPVQGETPDANASLSVPVPNDPVTFSDGNKGAIQPGDTGPYHGPDTYKLSSDQLQGGSDGLVWLAPFGGDQEPGGAGPNATLTITVHDDGSGEADFSGYMDPGSNTYAGKVTWTCSQ